LEIPIKSYTSFIGISVEGEVKDLREKIVKLSFNKNIAIDLMEGSTNFIDIYLIRTNQEKNNTLRVTGLNG
jgi:transposase